MCDNIVERLQDGIGSGIEIDRQYSRTRDLGTFIGRQIDVYPLRYARGEAASRREDIFDAWMGIVVCERYTEPAFSDEIPVPNDWVDERIDFVEQEVYNLLQASRIQILIGSPEDTNYEWVCRFAEVTDVYNHKYLNQHKVFWSEIELGFQRLKVGEV